MKTPTLLFSTVLLLGICGGAFAKDEWVIAPGVGIGQVKLGMEHVDVMRLLGTPTREQDLEETEPLGHIVHAGNDGTLKPLKGVIQDDWVKPLPVPAGDKSVQFMCDFVTVYFRDRKVVQIEERVARFKTADGLSVASTATGFRKRYPGYKSVTCLYRHPSNWGWPGCKHYMEFEDAVKEGIGWRYGAMGCLAPDCDPDGELETVIVHVPGAPLLMDPDGGARFIWKSPPMRRSDVH